MSDSVLHRKRFTTLELRVLRATKLGNVWDARAPGHGTRIDSQAIQRLKRMGYLRDGNGFTCVVADEGDRRIKESEERR